MKKELLKGLSEEQIAKIKACKNQEEILALAKEKGVELTNEQLAAIDGGCKTTIRCPDCGSLRVTKCSAPSETWYQCDDCRRVWH